MIDLPGTKRTGFYKKLEDFESHHGWGGYNSQKYSYNKSKIIFILNNWTLFEGEHGYSYHTILREEQRSFSNWINSNLGGISELKHLLPLKNDGADLYEKINDGILIWLE